MTKKFSTFLFLTLTLNTFGQGSQELSEKKWKVGAFVMPTILTPYETSRVIDFTFLAGLKCEKKLSNILSLTSGLNYLRTNLYHGVWYGAPCDNPMSICYIYSKTDYIEVPLTFKIYYLKVEQKANPYISFGVVNSFSFKDENKRIDVIGNKYQTSYFYNNKFQYQLSSLSVSFGTEVKLSERLGLIIEPTFRFSIQPMIRVMDFTNYTVFVGLGFGLNYKL